MRLFSVASTLLFSMLAFAGSGSNHPTSRVWITDVFIVSPENLDHIEKASVLIEDGRIAKVERGNPGKTPPGATVVSGHGQYLIPGLIDSHVHLAAVPGMSFDLSDGKQQPMVQQYFRQLPAPTLLRLHHTCRSGRVSPASVGRLPARSAASGSV
jgi:imidazolonepropionase-like amidohydrolase